MSRLTRGLPICIQILFLQVFLCSAAINKEILIIDTDPGADDAMAIMMILSDIKRFNVEAITCVQGNTGVHNASINALKTLDVMKRLDIPVYVGSPTGLVYRAKSDNYFGMDGFGDFKYINPPNIHLLKKRHAALELAERVKEQPGNISIICLGPLTNIALASHINPDFFKQVKSLMILGGSYKDEGNIGPGIEFNMYADPEAAEFIFSNLPADTTTVLLPFETIKEHAYIDIKWRLNVLGKIRSEKMDFLNLAENNSLKGSVWRVFDPALISVVLNPSIATKYMIGQPVVETSTRRGYMKIELYQGSVIVITELDKLLLMKTIYYYLQ